MRPDTTSRDEAGAAAYEAIRGRDEHIGDEVREYDGDGIARPLGPDPWGDVGPVRHPTRFDLPMSADPPF